MISGEKKTAAGDWQSAEEFHVSPTTGSIDGVPCAAEKGAVDHGGEVCRVNSHKISPSPDPFVDPERGSNRRRGREWGIESPLTCCIVEGGNSADVPVPSDAAITQIELRSHKIGTRLGGCRGNRCELPRQVGADVPLEGIGRGVHTSSVACQEHPPLRVHTDPGIYAGRVYIRPTGVVARPVVEVGIAISA